MIKRIGGKTKFACIKNQLVTRVPSATIKDRKDDR